MSTSAAQAGEALIARDPVQTAIAGKLRGLAAPIMAGVVLFSASLANFLNRNDYGFFRLDVAIVILVFLAVSTAMALLYVGQRQWGRSLLEGLLAYIFADLNSTLTALPIAAGLGVAALTYWKRGSLLGPMSLFGAVVLVTTVAGVQGRWSWIRTVQGTAPVTGSKPAVLHLILDEHLGLEGFSALGPTGQEVRNELEAAYRGAGFTLYGRAYSEHMHTANAIPQLLNYGQRLGEGHSPVGVRVGPTEHLRELEKSGYSMRIFQSDFADICSDATYASCTTYDSFSLRPLLRVPLSTTERSKLILLKFLTLSELAHSTVLSWNIAATFARKAGVKAPRFNLTSAALTSSVASFAALDQLNAQLAHARPGEAHLVHLLIPHYPYILSRHCKLLPKSDWDSRASASPIEKRQRAYFEQVRCVTSQILAAVERFRSSPGGKNGAVLIHGDHGSRINRIDPQLASIGKYSDADLIATFSTLFAVQTPAKDGGYVAEAQPITPLVQDFSRRGFASAPATRPDAIKGVYLDDHQWIPRTRVPLASSWTKASQEADRKQR